MNGELVGVGVGPGAPDLLTVRGVAELRAADRVFVPVLAAGEPGRAEAVVRAHVESDRVERLVFALGDDVAGPQERRHRHWDAAARRIAEQLGTGSAAFATLGDPAVYSTFGYLAATVRELLPGVRVRTVPGITAMQAAAAAAGVPLVEGTEQLTLLPLARGTAAVAGAVAGGGSVVAYKAGRRLGALRAVLEAAGALDRAIYAEHLGTPDERVAPLAEVDLAVAPYLSTVLVPPRRGGRGEQL